jgi:hypothetical protein
MKLPKYRDTVRDLLGHQLDQFRNRAVLGSGRLRGVCHVFHDVGPWPG